MEENINMEDNFNIEVNYYNENIDLSINSDYETFLKKICDFLKISPDEIDSYSLSYHDEDGDSILISTIEDYKLFIQQVQEKIVNKLIIEKKENNNINNSQNNNLYIKSNINNSQNNNYYINNNINNSQNDKSYLNSNIDNSYNNQKNSNYINNSLNNKNNNNNSNYIYNSLDNNIKDNKKDNKNDIQIENIVFNSKCSSCSVYPIVCVIYYCEKCDIYFCEECENKKDHRHPLIKIKNVNQFNKIKEEESKKNMKNLIQTNQIDNNNYIENQKFLYNKRINYNNYNNSLHTNDYRNQLNRIPNNNSINQCHYPNYENTDNYYSNRKSKGICKNNVCRCNFPYNRYCQPAFDNNFNNRNYSGRGNQYPNIYNNQNSHYPRQYFTYEIYHK